MTDNHHPITPPPELVQQWRTAPEYTTGAEKLTMVTMTDRRLQEIASQAACWGADQELEACCKWLQVWFWQHEDLPKKLRAARRPKPPSLKEQALQELDLLTADATTHGLGFDASAIRRALESLPD